MVGYKTEVGIAEAACYTDDYKIQCRQKIRIFCEKRFFPPIFFAISNVIFLFFSLRPPGLHPPLHLRPEGAGQGGKVKRLRNVDILMPHQPI